MIFKNIKLFCQEWRNQLRQKIINSGAVPTLGIIQCGDDEAANRYVRNTVKDCQEIGANVIVKKITITDSLKDSTFITTLLTMQETCDGIIIQKPIPDEYWRAALDIFQPMKDVSGMLKDSHFDATVPLGICKYLDYCGYDLDGKNVVIIGRSEIIGKPLTKMMLDRNATVTLCHSHSKNVKIDNIDLIITAVGKANFLDCGQVNSNTLVVDAAINFDAAGRMVGDCFNIEGKEVTPVPGGVGLLTRCALLDNLCKYI